MIRPRFSALKWSFPRTADRETLFADLGWNDLVSNPAYLDTCAIRMSYGLLLAGVALPGARMKAKGTTIAGKRIEPGQAKLSAILKRIWGAPEVYRGEPAARKGIGKRQGVVSFFRIHGISGIAGGHIDLVWPGDNGFADCARSCYFSAAEVWFWPLT